MDQTKQSKNLTNLVTKTIEINMYFENFPNTLQDFVETIRI